MERILYVSAPKSDLSEAPRFARGLIWADSGAVGSISNTRVDEVHFGSGTSLGTLRDSSIGDIHIAGTAGSIESVTTNQGVSVASTGKVAALHQLEVFSSSYGSGLSVSGTVGTIDCATFSYLKVSGSLSYLARTQLVGPRLSEPSLEVNRGGTITTIDRLSLYRGKLIVLGRIGSISNLEAVGYSSLYPVLYVSGVIDYLGSSTLSHGIPVIRIESGGVIRAIKAVTFYNSVANYFMKVNGQMLKSPDEYRLGTIYNLNFVVR